MKMKKLICIVLCAALLVSCGCMEAFASNEKNNPTILVSGFLCSQLYLNYGKENEEKVWGIDVNKVLDNVKSDLPELSKKVAGLALGKKEELGQTIGEAAYEILGKLACNPDGSSVYPLSFYPNNPETSNVKYMLENGFESNLYETNTCKHLASIADGSQIYCFQYDSRLDPITIAQQLNDFIKEVKAYTGAKKVNLFGLSFGGMILTTYLYLYGDACDADNLVMSVPAIGGTNIPDRLLRGNIDFDMENLAEFFETILGSEGNIARIFERSDYEVLEEVIGSACSGISDAIKYWGSIWALSSQETYEQLKKDFLDPTESKNIIEKCDIVHNEIMPNVSKILNDCREKGTNISILCSTGSTLALGGEENSDIVLPTSGVSGATCAPLGSRFADGYTGIKTSCSDPNHNHVSPSREVDASSAYLPENTWFVEDQYHGQYYYEEYTRSLVTKLLLTDEITDVYSNPDYPQFEYSNHTYKTIHVKFDNSKTGYLSSKDSALVVENLSTDSPVKILSVVSNGINLDFDSSAAGIIAAGETVKIPFEGEIPKVCATAARITVSYIKIGSLNSLRTFDFAITVDNGEAPTGKGGFVNADFESRLEALLPDFIYDFLVRRSLRQSFECVFNSITALFD